MMWAAIRAFLSTVADYARLMRLNRPIGIWLLLWPTLWALWIAGQGRRSRRCSSCSWRAWC